VYYQTHPDLHGEHAYPWKPIPLDRAVHILSCDRSFGAPARRRRAIVDVGAQLLLLLGVDTPEAEAERARLEAALSVLGFPAGSMLGSIHTSPEATRVQLEGSIQRLLDSSGSEAKLPCCACVEFCDIGRDDAGNYAHFRIKVARGFDGLAKVTDPQSWPACETDYFPELYYAGDSCPAATQGDPPKASNPPAAGSAYTGVVFENFQADLGNQQISWFKNLLNVETTLDQPNTYSFDYGLCASMSSNVLGDGKPDPVPGGFDEDCGFADVFPTGDTNPEQMFLDGYKRVKFHDRENLGLVDWAQLAMKIMVSGIANIGACCEAPSESCECHETCDQAFPTQPDPVPVPRARKLCQSPE